MPIEENNILTHVEELSLRLKRVTEKLKKDPFLIYDKKIGKEAIEALIDLHVIGSALIEAGEIDILKEIPLEM